MKKFISTIMTVFLLAGTAAAQLNPEYTRYNDRRQELKEATTDLVRAFFWHDIKELDNILTEYPQLVDIKIKNKNGEFLSMPYSLFLEIQDPIPPIVYQQLKQQEIINRKIDQDIDRAIKRINRKSKKIDKLIQRSRKRHERAEEYSYGIPLREFVDNPHTGILIEHMAFALFFIPCDIIAGRLYVVTKLAGQFADLRIAILDKQIENREEWVYNTKENKKERADNLSRDIAKVKEAIINSRFEMLKVFYKHGAKCEQCFEDSIKKGELTSTEEFIISNHISDHGINYNDLITLDEWIDKWLPLAKKIYVNSDNLHEFITKTISEQSPLSVLDKVSSDEPQTQQKIEEYREILNSAYAQLFNEQLQIASMEFPQVSVTFLDKTYEPKTADEIDEMIADIEEVCNYEIKAKLGKGEARDTNLITQKNKAIAELNKARTQLEKYEENIAKQKDIANKNQQDETAAKEKITKAVVMFKGNLDLLAEFLKYFPQAEEEAMGTVIMFDGRVDLAAKFLKQFSPADVKYYPEGEKIGDIPFQIPVIYNTKTGAVYDARPETFGKYLIEINK